MLPLSNILILIALVASVILLTQLIAKKDQNRFSSWVFMTYIFFQAFSVLLFLLIDTGWITHVWYLYRIPAPLTLAIAPLGYLYVRSMLQDESRFQRSDIAHFIPFFIGTVNYLPYFLSSSEVKRETVQSLVDNFSNTVVGQDGILPDEIMSSLRIFQGLFYVFLHIKLHRDSEFFKHESLTNFEKKLKRWLTSFSFIVSIQYISVFIFILSFIVLDVLAIPIDADDRVNTFVYSNGLIICLTTLFFATYLLVHPEVTLGKMIASEEWLLKSAVKLKKPGAERSETKNQDRAGVETLRQLFEETQIWKNPELTLHSLAQESGLGLRRTSYLLNNHFDGNVNTVINRYRVQHAEQLIKENYLDEYTIESLWSECGFTNHVTFYSAFKKEYGVTPLDFSKSLTSMVN